MNLETTSEFDVESEMSEISVEDEIDCSEFLKSESETSKSLVPENYVEFARISKDKSNVLKEKGCNLSKSANSAEPSICRWRNN